MHIEVLVEDSSGARLVEALLPRVIGDYQMPHTWRIHRYKGVGKLPRDLGWKADPSKRALLDNLKRLLNGIGRTPGIDAVVVIVDSDRRDCRQFLGDLMAVLAECREAPRTMFRLAIEEMEAWLLGDRPALLRAYPRAKSKVLNSYVQDSVCGTWEMLADAVHPGGASTIKLSGWPAPGRIKHEWVEKIEPFMDVENNQSPSFRKFRDGLRRLVA